MEPLKSFHRTVNILRYNQILVESPTVTPVDLRKKLGHSEKINTKRESNGFIGETLDVIEETLNKVAKDLEAVRFR